MIFKHSKIFFSLLLTIVIFIGCNSSSTNSDSAAVVKDPPRKVIHIGYQGMINPWKYGIESGAFEKATGWQIEWRKFNSGSEVITGMASGDIQIAVAGSSPIATAMSRGVDVELFWILEAIRDNEALVARDGSGIKTISDLKGKTIGVPFASTTHYHLMVAIELNQIPRDELKILNLQPDAIMAAWNQKSIDAAFVWSPILNEIKKTGKVILLSGELADAGKPTFDGMIVLKKFAAENPSFMNKFVQTIAQIDKDYRDNKKIWTSESNQVQSIAKLTGANVKDIPLILSQYHFPDLKEQCSTSWLGGGAASALYDTSVFLQSQNKISQVHQDYSIFINDRFAKDALESQSAKTN